MADTTTIATQGHFGTATDRIVAIATQGHYLLLVVEPQFYIYAELGDTYAVAELGNTYATSEE